MFCETVFKFSVEMPCVQQWDCIEIEEETDDNRIVKSNIRVPMQVLQPYFNLSLGLCFLIYVRFHKCSFTCF